MSGARGCDYTIVYLPVVNSTRERSLHFEHSILGRRSQPAKPQRQQPASRTAPTGSRQCAACPPSSGSLPAAGRARRCATVGIDTTASHSRQSAQHSTAPHSTAQHKLATIRSARASSPSCAMPTCAATHVQYSTVQYSTVQYSTIRRAKTQRMLAGWLQPLHYWQQCCLPHASSGARGGNCCLTCHVSR